MLVECLYYRPGQAGLPRAAYERSIAECTRYIKNFNVSAASDLHYPLRVVHVGRAAAVLEAGSPSVR